MSEHKFSKQAELDFMHNLSHISEGDRWAKHEIESLRQQLADMTAERDRLLGIMCEIAGSKSLTATPTQFYQHLQRIASDATITNPAGIVDSDHEDWLAECHRQRQEDNQ